MYTNVRRICIDIKYGWKTLEKMDGWNYAKDSVNNGTYNDWQELWKEIDYFDDK